MAKQIIAIPIDRLCQRCGKGRLISNGMRRSKVIGEFVGKSYRVCNHCGADTATSERFIGVEIDIPENNHPSLFNESPDAEFREMESTLD